MSKHPQLHLFAHLFIALALCAVYFPWSSYPAMAEGRIQAGTTIEVTTQTDELNTDGDCSLREALYAANWNTAVDACPAGTGLDTVSIPPGIYNLTVIGADEDDGLTGDLDIFEDAIIVGASLTSTILDGQDSDRIFQVTADVEVRFINLTLRNGYAQGTMYGGGGILNGSADALPGTIQVINCLFTQNRAENTSGGLENVGTATVTNVSFVGNEAAYGGGVFSDGTLILNGVTMQQNSASKLGGGLYNHTGATLINVTLSDNSAEEGGGLFNDGNMTMLNVTLANNTTAALNNGTIRSKNVIYANSTAGDNCSGHGTYTSAGHNLDSGDTCGLSSLGDLVDANPLLGPLQNNQGPTLTHALLADSPAIDTGDNTDCPLQDQRGAYRPADGDNDTEKICDIGAYEAGGVFPFYTYLPSVARH